MGTRWLDDAVLYQIYPQTFSDSNGDGVGDLRGITERLDYLRWLGVTAIWISPCFTSPFRDAGYDIADYMTIAARYGTSDDLAQLTDAAHERGIRVLLDLVVGHTSDQHPWFTAAADDDSDHRYIWATTAGPNLVPSPGRRQGYYLRNFLDCQPSLNFGYARPDVSQPWRQPPDSPAALRNRAAIREIMDHWLAYGVDGFRCDMAYSLVKDDPGAAVTGQLWAEIRAWLDRTHPHAVLLAEWGRPHVSVPAGFHADFFLHFNGDALRSLWDNGGGVVRDGATVITPFVDPNGRGSAATFLADWQTATAAIGDRGQVVLPSSNHDFSRLAAGGRDIPSLKAAFALLLTWPTIPAIYYGDEIGMRFIHGVPDVEGSQLGPRNNRAGSRTPMQWNDSPNAGFSTAIADRLYLPIDPDPKRPTVAAQVHDPESLLSSVRRLLQLRRNHLRQASRTVHVLSDTYPLTYLRGDRHLITVNPSAKDATHPVPDGPWEPILTAEADIDAGHLHVAAYGYGVFQHIGRQGAMVHGR